MTFDAPNREVCVARRAITNTPLQALVLLNDPTYVEASRKLAERMLLEGGKTTEERITYGMRCATARTPSVDEQRILADILEKAKTRFRNHQGESAKLLAVGESPINTKLNEIELASWTTVAATLLNLDETISRR